MGWREQLGRRIPRGWKQPFRALVGREYSRVFDGVGVWKRMSWLGVPIQKNPADLWVYQEILHEVRPDLIIETGTLRGGSALYLASICDLLGAGTVITIDIEEQPNRPEHRRIEYVHGSSTDPSLAASVAARAADRAIMVVLDSNHERGHVLDELDSYASLVTPGSYLIVEDTNINGHPVRPTFGPGPWEALSEWLPRHPEFEIDRAREKFLTTSHPRGYLRRV